ncbi:carboxypeptidase N subunit 2-like, partial [Saccostrea cucullata]|uniref:carboxypeptidase N subunit 2-like n=1 Tax=Saccostrea cuccullata TaxID=36930 RepID=UPI002ED0EADC
MYFQNVVSLRLISDNKLTTIENNTFDNVASLRELWIYDNPLQCDCKLQYLIDFINSRTLTLYNDPLCVTPDTLKGTRLQEVSFSSLTCLPDDITTEQTTGQTTQQTTGQTTKQTAEHTTLQTIEQTAEQITEQTAGTKMESTTTPIPSLDRITTNINTLNSSPSKEGKLS